MFSSSELSQYRKQGSACAYDKGNELDGILCELCSGRVGNLSRQEGKHQRRRHQRNACRIDPGRISRCGKDLAQPFHDAIPPLLRPKQNAKQTQRAGLFRGTTLFTRQNRASARFKGRTPRGYSVHRAPWKRPSHSACPGSLSAGDRPLFGCANATPLRHRHILPRL